jgi:hypothetical protein
MHKLKASAWDAFIEEEEDPGSGSDVENAEMGGGGGSSGAWSSAAGGSAAGVGSGWQVWQPQW